MFSSAQQQMRGSHDGYFSKNQSIIHASPQPHFHRFTQSYRLLVFTIKSKLLMDRINARIRSGSQVCLLSKCWPKAITQAEFGDEWTKTRVSAVTVAETSPGNITRCFEVRP